MKKLAMRAWIIVMVLVLGMASVACGESGSAEAHTEDTSAESSYAGAGDASSGAAEAHTPNTDAEASYAGAGGASSASGYAATPDTTAETSVTGTGSSSSSSSYSSTTTTTTTTTSTSSSSSSSSSAGGSGSWDPLPWPPAPPAPRRHSSGSSAPVDSIVKSEDVTGKGWTIISKVNVRSLASTKASLVRQISSASTEVMVTSDVLNSAGERWYGVKLYSGYVGYIRADLLRVELEKQEAAPAAAAATAATAVPTASYQIPSGAKNHRVIYVIVEPVEEETEEEPEIIYITPEQAAEMGLLDGTDLQVEDEDSEMPING